MLTAWKSTVALCFEDIGVTAAKLTEQAVIAEHASAATEAISCQLPVVFSDN